MKADLKALLAKITNTPIIVEEGTSGIWTYRKWSSGVAECWGNRTQSVTFSTIATYYHRATFASISLPTDLFISTPVVTTAVSSSLWCSGSATSTALGTTYIYDVSNGTYSPTVGYYLVGRWKQ